MNGFKKTRLLIGAAATGLALVAGLLLWAQVSAAMASITVDDATAAPGEEATVAVTADVPDGLGAWTIDISYDPDVVTPTSCDGGDANSVCNTDFGPDTVRVTGASAQGITTEKVLGNITFQCADSEGDSDLTVSLNVLADATIGDPQDITADASVSNGSVSCAEPVVVEATNTPKLPETGAFDGSSGDSNLGWILAALSMAGLAAVAGVGALKMRTRQ